MDSRGPWGMEKLLRNLECPLTTSSRCIFAPVSSEISLVLMTSVRRILTQPVSAVTLTEATDSYNCYQRFLLGGRGEEAVLVRVLVGG